LKLACELRRTIGRESVTFVDLVPVETLEHEDSLRHVRAHHLRDHDVLVVGEQTGDELRVACFLGEVELGA